MSCVLDARLRQLAKTNPNSFLVIGYGNNLRGDDGIGQQVAAEIDQWNLPYVHTQAVHQLTPELAEELARVRCVVFVDARICGNAESLNPDSSPSVQVLRLEPDYSPNVNLGHYANPRSLLALTSALYGHYPQGWLVSVPGVNFELGETLSSVAQKGVAAALEQIDLLINGQSSIDSFLTKEIKSEN